jgi:formyltetrahydrofolate synthetase
MAALLKDALKPNLVQTLEGTPALFTEDRLQYRARAIIIATKMAMHFATMS